jgi:hypothetical protein
MVYDLCIPKKKRSPFYNLPLQSKPIVAGINLLWCSRQIYNEVSQRLRLWNSHWRFRMAIPSTPVESATEVNCSLAMSDLHDLALARIRYLHLDFRTTTNPLTTFGLHDLKTLLKLKSLICIIINLHMDTVGLTANALNNLETSLFVTGFVVRVFSHIPTFVETVGWYIYYPGDPWGRGDTLRKIAEQYKSVKGSAYTVQQNSGSLSQPIEISVSQHF